MDSIGGGEQAENTTAILKNRELTESGMIVPDTESQGRWRAVVVAMTGHCS